MTNKLSLNIPDIQTDCILRVEDTSVYADLMPYQCPTLQVLVPGYKDCVEFNSTSPKVVGKGFIFNLTACDLELQFSQCGSLYNEVPDGIYVIKYSMSPNEQLYVEYNHLRVTAIRKQLKAELSKLKLGACEPGAEVDAKFKDLMRISGYIDAAKAAAEYGLDAEKGMLIYNYAKKLLDGFTCKLY
jgi:hypothetical protein